jgi:hypothetical protein
LEVGLPAGAVGEAPELEQAAADTTRAARARVDNSLELMRESPCGMFIADPAVDRRPQLYGNSNHSVNRLAGEWTGRLGQLYNLA